MRKYGEDAQLDDLEGDRHAACLSVRVWRLSLPLFLYNG
jgi:hypothetical protein